MAEQRQDRRVRRSKAQLRQALIQLLQEKPVEEITVRELTERADVNRGTFYSHYQNIYHMLEQVKTSSSTSWGGCWMPIRPTCSGTS